MSNHLFGIADGLILTHTIAAKYVDFRAIGNHVLELIPQLSPAIAVVNVFEINPKEYLQALDNVFSSEFQITHFPAGLVSRIKSLKIRDNNLSESQAKTKSNSIVVRIYHKVGIQNTAFKGLTNIFFCRIFEA